MVTVLREAGFAVRIYKADHEPAHVHVVGDGEVKIELYTLAIVRQRGMTAGELRRALALVRNNRDALLAAWRNMHG